MGQDETTPRRREWERLLSALAAWTGTHESRNLERWLKDQVEESGVLRRFPIPLWVEVLSRLADARRLQGGWPPEVDARIARILESCLRFSRVDGTPATCTATLTAASARARASLYQYWRDVFEPAGEGSARVIETWFPAPNATETALPPPLPSWSAVDRPLASLRANWRTDGDFAVVDHREPGGSTRFELTGGGTPWLGPDWQDTWPETTTRVSRSSPRIVASVSDSRADLLEWSYKTGTTPGLRTAVLLRGHRLALLGQQVEGQDPDSPRVSTSWGLGPMVTARPSKTARTLFLKARGRKSSAQLVPVGLPCLPHATDRGELASADGRLRLSQARTGPRNWLPLVVSWDPARHRQRVEWRGLTVTEEGRICDSQTAVAYRIRWGLDETIVIYRSLANPAVRAFLGHQTRARFLIGLFSTEGALKTLIALD
jgi:hypothetical protein